MVVRARTEYHAQRYLQGEMTTHGQLARLWLASHLRLGASVWVSPPVSILMLSSRLDVILPGTACSRGHLCGNNSKLPNIVR